jgi:hypothetical protein
MPSETYRQDMIDRVVAHALAAAKASQDGKTHLVLGDGMTAQRLSLREGGYCARFVRQVYETGCEFGEGRWRYAAPSALEMCKKLADDKHEVTDGSLTPGDIVGINRNCGAYGHVALYVGKIQGKDMIAENTSSGTRGNPRRAGTKLTPFEELRPRVTGVYRLLAGVKAAHWPGFRAFLYSGSQCREIELMPNGDHRLDQGKTYWRLRQ